MVIIMRLMLHLNKSNGVSWARNCSNSMEMSNSAVKNFAADLHVTSRRELTKYGNTV
jgi:hypothetical protein